MTVLERDELPDAPHPRRGVPQGAQVHLMLERGWSAAEELLPGLRAELLDYGAARFNSGRMPWLGEYGWLDTNLPGFELVSVTRPLLELHHPPPRAATTEVAALLGTTRRGMTNSRRTGGRCGPQRVELTADLVVDASGRSSRLPYLAGRSRHHVPEPEVVDAHLGYATRLYAAPAPCRCEPASSSRGTPETGTGGLAMPVERRPLAADGRRVRRPPAASRSARFLGFLAGPA